MYIEVIVCNVTVIFETQCILSDRQSSHIAAHIKANYLL